MRQITNYGDSRNQSYCVYCGGVPDTRDHIPSRVFLDEPYPENLPVVPSCYVCNNSFSLNEEYLACLIECVICGSTDHEKLTRQKIRNILNKKTKLTLLLERSSNKNLFNDVFFIPDYDRVNSIILKLARGHFAFENNEPQLAEPSLILTKPLISMSKREREGFEELSSNSLSVYPEVGSRSMQRLFTEGNTWTTVQPNRYRYLTMTWPEVRLVISEYLAAIVIWEDD